MLNHAASVNKQRLDARIEAERKQADEPQSVDLQKHTSEEWAEYYGDWSS